jgi:plasmid stability protein
MAKRNLTIQLDEDLVRRVRVAAAQHGTSVSRLVGHQLEKLADDAERYDDAWARARKTMAAAKPRGGRTWTRDEIYDR